MARVCVSTAPLFRYGSLILTRGSPVQFSFSHFVLLEIAASDDFILEYLLGDSESAGENQNLNAEDFNDVYRAEGQNMEAEADS